MNQFKKYRRLAGLTQAEVAEALGVTSSAVQGWEYGKSHPQTKHWDVLADLYKIPKEDLALICQRPQITGDHNVQTVAGRDVHQNGDRRSFSGQEEYFWRLYRRYGTPDLMDKWIGQLLLIKQQVE